MTITKSRATSAIGLNIDVISRIKLMADSSGITKKYLGLFRCSS